jgi:hypothetical protein
MKSKTIRKTRKGNNRKGNGRKGPSVSATLFPEGTNKIGNDGNMWTVVLTKKGVHRWVKAVHRAIKADHHAIKPKGKQYLIHDNGGRPFLVAISGKNVSIFKLPKYTDDAPKTAYTEFIKEYKNVKKVFIGKSPKIDMTIFSAGYGPMFDGNTILLEVSNQRYCLISSDIVEFSTKDTIKKFISPVGNSDVPYPLAYGSSNVYVFGFDEHKYIPNDTVTGLTIDELFEKYTGKCCPWKSELDKFKKKLAGKIIHKRI